MLHVRAVRNECARAALSERGIKVSLSLPPAASPRPTPHLHRMPGLRHRRCGSGSGRGPIGDVRASCRPGPPCAARGGRGACSSQCREGRKTLQNASAKEVGWGWSDGRRLSRSNLDGRAPLPPPIRKTCFSSHLDAALEHASRPSGGVEQRPNHRVGQCPVHLAAVAVVHRRGGGGGSGRGQGSSTAHCLDLQPVGRWIGGGACAGRVPCAEVEKVEACMREGGGGGHGFTCIIIQGLWCAFYLH